MWIWSFALLVSALLALPGLANAQNDAAAIGKTTQSKSDTQSAAQSDPVENWGALEDLKTGLQASSYTEMTRDEQPEFVRQMVRVQWRAHDPIELWISRPKVAGKVPVVLYLYGYQDTGEQFRDNGWCRRATADGFAAVGFASALTDYRFRFRPLKQWFVSELAESLGTTAHDVQFVLNYLAGRGDMDMDQVGMLGMGSGASIAILAAHADRRVKALDLLDPWGDWPEWLKGSPAVPDNERSKYLTSEFLKSVATLDPVAYLPSLGTRRLRVQQTLSETDTPKIAKERIAAAVPNPNQLVQYANARDLMKAWQTTGLSGWIKQQTRPKTAHDGGDDSRAALDSQGRADENQK